jgi:hypothetical protein
MDTWTTQHLANWAEREFWEDNERDEAIQLITDLWNSDAEYFASKCHSYWELLDMAKTKRCE